jgi:hypothetical protein
MRQQPFRSRRLVGPPAMTSSMRLIGLLLTALMISLLFGTPVSAETGVGPTFLNEGERHQVIQFNPTAALQSRIFADRFVPNSREFRARVNGIAYAGQRAEDLRTGVVRVYYCVVDDWANVRYAQRGDGDALGRALLAEGERQQGIQGIEFNPNAALQSRIFADGFVPNSSEFTVDLFTEPWSFSAQRAEDLRTGTVRVYYVLEGDWSNVRYVQRPSATTATPVVFEADRTLSNAGGYRLIWWDVYDADTVLLNDRRVDAHGTMGTGLADSGTYTLKVRFTNGTEKTYQLTITVIPTPSAVLPRKPDAGQVLGLGVYLGIGTVLGLLLVPPSLGRLRRRS